MYNIIVCTKIDKKIANHKNKLLKIPILNIDWFSDKAFKEFHISIKTKTVKLNVIAFCLF